MLSKTNANTKPLDGAFFIFDNGLLTDDKRQDIYPAATLEGDINQTGKPNAINVENAYYSINTDYVVAKSQATGITNYVNKNGGASAGSPPVNNNPSSNVTDTSQKLYKLNASTNKIGLGMTLKVMAGQ